MTFDDIDIAVNDIIYVHKPVTDEDGIRLIILEPSKDQGGPLRLSLVHSSLSQFESEEVDQYTALSYVWGEATASSVVVVDGRQLAITASLGDALNNIRDEEKAIKIWADGICIDQTNQKEKGTQVALMGRIYEMASHTVVYLGAEADGSERAMAEARGSLATRYVGNLHRKELTSLLSRPWFTRTWIYQELVLSKRPQIYAGRSSCSWEEFCTLIDKDAIRPGREPKPGKVTNPNSCQNVLYLIGLRHSRTYGIVNGTIINQFRAARQAFHGENERDLMGSNSLLKDVPSELNTLLRILEERRGLDVTDPRDMVYAYLGLTRGTGIVANYSVPPTDVFTSFAKYLLKECGSEALFEHVHKSTHPFWWSSKKEGMDLPSWVPDWTCEAPISNIRIFLETAEANKTVLSNEVDDWTMYKAGCNSRSQLWLSPKSHPEIIATMGRILIDIGDLEDQHYKICVQETHGPNREEGTLPAFLVNLVCSNPGWKLVEFPVSGKLTVLAIPSITKAGDVISLFHGSSRAYLLRPYLPPQDSNADSAAIDIAIRKELYGLLEVTHPEETMDPTVFSSAARQLMHFEIIGGIAVASPNLLMDPRWESVPLNAKDNRIIVLH